MWFLLILVGLALVSGGLTACLVEGIRRWSQARALFDLPNARSSHARPVPRLGGLALAPVLLLGLGLWAWRLPPGLDGDGRALLAVLGGAALVALVSLIDDLRSLPPAVRFPAHLLAGFVVAGASGGITLIAAGPLGTVDVTAPWSLVLAALWVTWFVNAFNFMDGIDGIAGTQALVAGGAWIAYGLVTGAPLLMGAGAVLAGTALGFLAHNWAPARIFMGDVGSAPLGLLLATVPWALGRADLWLASLLPLWPFLFDTGVTLLRRAARGERLWEAHRSHLYQRLVIHGWSHRAVATLYAALAAAGAAGGVLLLTSATALASSWVGIVAVGCTLLWATVAQAERTEPRAAGTESDA